MEMLKIILLTLLVIIIITTLFICIATFAADYISNFDTMSYEDKKYLVTGVEDGWIKTNLITKIIYRMITHDINYQITSHKEKEDAKKKTIEYIKTHANECIKAVKNEE